MNDREEEMEGEEVPEASSQLSQAAPSRAADTQKSKRGKKPANPDFPCLCCGENCTKSQAAVKCIMCTLWAHKDCVKMPDATFKLLEEQVKEGGSAYWVCRPCQQFGQRIKHQFAEVNRRQDESERRIDETNKRMDGTEKRMEALEKEMKRMAEKTDKEIGERDDRLCDEMQEREVRRMNLIIHGIEEQPERIKNSRERLELDKERCEQLLITIKARTRKDDLRFCRRIGEKGDGPRPMVIGLETEDEKRHILARARNLHGSRYHDISIVPDLTKKQRSNEARMKREAEERNKNLTNEDKSRNMKWLVVGRRGEKRLIKGVERDVQFMGNRNNPPAARTAAEKQPDIRGPQLLPSAPPRGQFQPRQGSSDDQHRREDDENGRWYRKDKEADTGARKKDNYGKGNSPRRDKDQHATSTSNRWEPSPDRWSQPRDRLGSKRGRGSASSEDENPSRQRTKRY
jgi:hypothetical protein